MAATLVQQPAWSSLETPISFEWNRLERVLLQLELSVAEKEQLQKFGHSHTATIKELHRKMLSEIIIGLSEQHYLINGKFDLVGFQTDPTKAFIRYLATLPESEQHKFIQTLDSLLKNWSKLGNYPFTNPYKIIFDKANKKIESYFKFQTETLLGEKMKLDPQLVYAELEMVGASAGQLNNAKGYAEKWGMQQRLFEYTLLDQDIPSLIRSTKQFADSRGNEDRDAIEIANLEKLLELTKLKIGSFIIEVSPPKFEWQTEIMVRCYQRTADGWQVTQISVPTVGNTWPELNTVISSGELVNNLQTRIMRTIEGDGLESVDNCLAQFTLIDQPDLEVGELVDKIKLVTDFSNYATLKATSSAIRARIAKSDDRLKILTNHILQTPPQDIDYTASGEEYQQLIAGVTLANMDKSSLVEAGVDPTKVDELMKISRSEDFLNQVSTDNGYLNHIANSYGRNGSISLNGDCGRIDLGQPPVISSAAPSQLTSTHLPNEQYTINSAGILSSCPVCHRPNISTKLERCPGCRTSLADIHEAFYCGKDSNGRSIQDLRGSLAKASSNNIRSQENKLTSSNETGNFFFRLIESIFPFMSLS